MKALHPFLFAALIVLGACSKNNEAQQPDNSLNFEVYNYQKSHRLVGSAADFFADADMAYTDSVSLVIPKSIFGRPADKLNRAIMELAFDTVSPDVPSAVNSFAMTDAAQFSYPLADTAKIDILQADGFAMVTGSVINLTNSLLVYQLQSSAYAPHAVHPMTTCYYLNYQMQQDKLITASDLFELATIDSLVDKIADRASEMVEIIGPTTIDSLPDHQNFYISGRGEIVFVYQPYEIASYAQGLISISFDPYELVDFMTPYALKLFKLEDL